ncbi:MAG TPA: hypothetical protein VJ901_02505 [Thermoanaerobaculia bacterium]|nr:hypothetical protein [Thermoanaerobaculia bacterium]
MQRSKTAWAALAAALFISAPLFASHLVLEANPAIPFPFLARFGSVTLHIYPHGIRGETIWLNGFVRNEQKDITVENPFARMYTEVPVARIGAIVGKLVAALPATLAFTSAPPVEGPLAGTVHSIAANRYRIVYGAEAWIDVWTTKQLGDVPQLRAIGQQIVGAISPWTAKSFAAIPDVPVYIELNFSHFHKLAILKVKTLTSDDDGEEAALQSGKFWVHAAVLDSLWK